MSLPWRLPVGCVVHTRRSNSLLGTDESHGQCPSRDRPFMIIVVSSGRPTGLLLCMWCACVVGVTWGRPPRFRCFLVFDRCWGVHQPWWVIGARRYRVRQESTVWALLWGVF